MATLTREFLSPTTLPSSLALIETDLICSYCSATEVQEEILDQEDTVMTPRTRELSYNHFFTLSF